jgi:hypothetical protein
MLQQVVWLMATSKKQLCHCCPNHTMVWVLFQFLKDVWILPVPEIRNFSFMHSEKGQTHEKILFHMQLSHGKPLRRVQSFHYLFYKSVFYNLLTNRWVIWFQTEILYHVILHMAPLLLLSVTAEKGNCILKHTGDNWTF